jgi:methionyl-tRNA formyltransferase
MLAAPEATVDALVVENRARNSLTEFAAPRGIAVIDKCSFAPGRQPLVDRQGAWLINVNSTLIIPADVLELFEGRSLNFHPGLLPEYAGLHTHQWAIRNGEREFGVTVHRIERRIDSGAIVGQVRFPIRPEDTGLSLFSHCLAAGVELFSRIVAQIVRGEALIDVPQDLTRRRLYRHRDALDGAIDWNQSAMSIVNFIRAGNYEPFASPTYVARLDKVADFDVEALRATKERGSTAHPGTVLEVSSGGPLIACGDGAAIRIIKARSRRQVISPDQWHDYASHLPGRRLLGRSKAER